jgi:hypothetical protein
MNISEVSRCSGSSTKLNKPNYWIKVIQLLDQLFQLGSGNDSTLKRISQGFDQAKGEHVIRLEYRVKASNQNSIAAKPLKVRLKPSDNKK